MKITEYSQLVDLMTEILSTCKFGAVIGGNKDCVEFYFNDQFLRMTFYKLNKKIEIKRERYQTDTFEFEEVDFNNLYKIFLSRTNQDKIKTTYTIPYYLIPESINRDNKIKEVLS